jgi:hypothetical protein
MFTGWNHMELRPEMWDSATNKVLQLSIRRPSNWQKNFNEETLIVADRHPSDDRKLNELIDSH